MIVKLIWQRFSGGEAATLFFWTLPPAGRIIRLMGDRISIYLSKPGGQREGPYTLEQIRRDLAAKKYQDTDYWAWHDGLPEWVPLYNLPGMSEGGSPATPAPPAPPPARTAAPAKPQVSAPASSPAASSQPPSAPAPEPGPEEVPLPPQVAAGMPFAALEHVFLFTTGEGPAAWQSPEVARMLEAIIGTDLDSIRKNVPRDVVAKCAAGELLKPDGSISDAVWRAMTAYQPDLVQQARARLHRVCVRTFRIEAETVAALVLFYNKQKL
jgi:hypothetical protein